jgi:glycosyltransferase involved in cell wall biosynthesis
MAIRMEIILWGSCGVIYVRNNFLQLIPLFFAKKLQAKYHSLIGSASALASSTLNELEGAKLRTHYLRGKARLLVFFGFIYPGKGVEHLFDVINPDTDSLVIAGGVLSEAYMQQLLLQSRQKKTDESTQFLGFLNAEEAANLLTVADAVVLPFIHGAGDWNTSVHGALAQGTLVVTTAVPLRESEVDKNLFFVNPGDSEKMRSILSFYGGRKVAKVDSESQWGHIGRAHLAFYVTALTALQ